MNHAEGLKALEEQLLQSEFRKDRAAVSAVLAEDFREFGSSGHIYNKEQILAALENEPPVSISLVDFWTQQLSVDVVLVTYKSIRGDRTALRSSVWVFREEHWQIIFHQGTKLA